MNLQTQIIIHLLISCCKLILNTGFPTGSQDAFLAKNIVLYVWTIRVILGGKMQRKQGQHALEG